MTEEPRKISDEDLPQHIRDEVARRRAEPDDNLVELLPGEEGAYKVMIPADMLADMPPEVIAAVKEKMRGVASQVALDRVRREAGDPDAPAEYDEHQLFEGRFTIPGDEE